jgi:hypothetical protein
MCKDFFTVESERLLVFYGDPFGNYLTARSLPADCDRNLPGIYFLKVNCVKITRENVNDSIVVSDLFPASQTSAESILLIAREVYFPVILNVKTQVEL